jgi:hypothetical protein
VEGKVDIEDRRYRSGQLIDLFGHVTELIRQTRFVPGAVDSLRRTLDWVGLDYDEGEFSPLLIVIGKVLIPSRDRSRRIERSIYAVRATRHISAIQPTTHIGKLTLMMYPSRAELRM